jgi:TPR repeat protein
MDKIEYRYRFKFLNDVDETKIIDLFSHDIIDDIDDNKYWNYIGLYYERKIKNYDLMEKYYLMAIDKGNYNAMYNLGHYYENIEKMHSYEDHSLMKKYYLMAIDNGNDMAMVRLGNYYCYIEINYDLMKKYYLMAIDKGNNDAMYRLGKHYQYVDKNYDLMKKYYLMALDRGNLDAYNNLKCNYYTIERYNANINIIISQMDIELIIKCRLENMYLNDKILLNIDLIEKNYKFIKHMNWINLVSCD